MSDLTLQKFSGPEIKDHIASLAKLRMTVFREFPYLYDDNEAHEEKFMQTYLHSPRSFIVLVLDKNKVVGATAAIPLADEASDLSKTFSEHNYDINSIFYFAESVLLPEYRGQQIGVKFFEAREAEAKRQGFTTAAFGVVQRPDQHPSRPKTWFPLNKFWERMGFVEHKELTTEYQWKDLHDENESKKALVFWIKKL